MSFNAIKEKRRTAKELKKSGITRAEIEAILGVLADTIGKWLKLKDSEFTLKKRGRKTRENKLLTDAQESHVKKLTIDKSPDQLKLNNALWTRESVRELILQETGVEIAIRTTGEYL
ncbi:TPA: hypothetical protein L4F62_006493 [Pseudomonas aeruginosa]|uniref:hypothetical protein n=1 Tax=Pseudomonas aeruginosa TaxID=287 RepID=UPI0025549B89|nr:hypothetical protein [Pseudomonas aeruginosa]HBO1619931.1 hypothetical protein [Pseudomonas aeruginosa]HBO9387500.1 winged helix-turn-helix domain-containing protein [Pseudomonas aeruginosa]